nr:hypothetical protein CFP56_69449 [Quercus suber]
MSSGADSILRCSRSQPSSISYSAPRLLTFNIFLMGGKVNTANFQIQVLEECDLRRSARQNPGRNVPYLTEYLSPLCSDYRILP